MLGIHGEVPSSLALMPDTKELKAFIEELAQLSSEIIVPNFGDPSLEVVSKADESPVTFADREAERVMRELIESRYPDHGIIGEEYGNVREDAEFVWVLDPIDGTISFTAGCPLFGTLIGLLENGEPKLGCINQPVLKQLCIGDGKTTTLNGKPATVRSGRSIAESTLLTTDVGNVEKYQNGELFHQLRSEVKVSRTWGDCYGYLLVACGFADAMVDPILNPWDLLPLIPVIEGAGGVITGWDGNVAKASESAIAACPELHAEIQKKLNG